MWTHLGFQTLLLLVLCLIPSLAISVSNSQMPSRSNCILAASFLGSAQQDRSSIKRWCFTSGTLLTRDWIKNKKSCFL